MMQICMPSWHSCCDCECRPTFVFSYVLESKCEARILSLDNAHFAERALSDNAQQAEVVEVDCEISC
jgi:hypothetical protein